MKRLGRIVLKAALIQLVAVGVGRAFQRALHGPADPEGAYFRLATIFNGREFAPASQRLRGGETFTAFGGTELDLTKAGLGPSAHIRVATWFGGSQVTVSPDWNVDVRGTAFAGENEVRLSGPGSDGDSLVIELITRFGGALVTDDPDDELTVAIQVGG